MQYRRLATGLRRLLRLANCGMQKAPPPAGPFQFAGNVIIGYDELYTGDIPICSDSRWLTQADCEANNEVWSSNHKSGSQNPIIGFGHRYSQSVSLITGSENTVNRGGNVVLSGYLNVTSGNDSIIISGSENTAGGGIHGGTQLFSVATTTPQMGPTPR